MRSGETVAREHTVHSVGHKLKTIVISGHKTSRADADSVNTVTIDVNAFDVLYRICERKSRRFVELFGVYYRDSSRRVHQFLWSERA